MGGITDSSPEAPDPYETANSQMGINRRAMYDSAAVNQINQQGPGYNIGWSGEIGDPSRTMTYSLDEGRQGLADYLGGTTTDQAQMIGGPIDYSGVSGIPGQGDLQAYQEGITGDMYNSLQSRIAPQQEQFYSQQTTDLANRGLPVGQEASNDVMESMARQFQDQNLGAAGQAQIYGQQAGNQLFNQGMASHQQGMSDIGFDRNQNMQELAMMINANPYNSTQIQNPTQYQMSPADLMGMTASNYNAEMGGYGSNMGALGQIGGMGAMGMMS